MAATNPSSKLGALMSAAIALPGVNAYAASPLVSQDSQFDYSYAFYEETGDRMEVDVHQASLNLAVGDNSKLRFTLIRDIMSGASPVFNRRVSGEPVQVLTKATIKDERKAGDIGFEYAEGDNIITLNGGQSNEDDYKSNFGSVGYGRHFNKKNTTLNFGLGYSADQVGSVSRTIPNGDKIKREYLVGITQLINKTSYLQLNLAYYNSTGYLTDPYKLVFIEGVGVRRENRPDKRQQYTLLWRYVSHFTDSKSTLHADYRYSRDDWGVRSHTVELTWKAPLENGWQLMPRIRKYTQNNADFYETVFSSTPDNGYQSSDYRLATFGVTGYELSVQKLFGKSGSKIVFGAEYHDRSYDSSYLGGKGSSIDDFNYVIYKASINFSF